MNAVKLYVATARLVLENEQFDYTACKAISRSFTSLELSLMCTVCRRLLCDPYSPADPTCQHHVCQRCLGGHKKLKPSCSWCKDWSQYTRNTQLRSLLACYQGLCQYIQCSDLLQDHPNSMTEPEKSVLVGVTSRGAQLGLPSAQLGLANHTDTVVGHEPGPAYPVASARRDGDSSRCYRRFNSSATVGHDSSAATSSEDESSAAADCRRSPQYSVATAEKPNTESQLETLRLQRLNSSEESAASDAESRPMYSVAFASTRSKLILKRRNVPQPHQPDRPKEDTNRVRPPAVAYTLQTSPLLKNRRYKLERNSRGRFSTSKYKSNACKCGTGASPGKFTCCGQRCVCYMQKKACSGCRCRGCRNPHLIDGVKIISKFLTNNDHAESKLLASAPPSYTSNGAIDCLNEGLPTVAANSPATVDIS